MKTATIASIAFCLLLSGPSEADTKSPSQTIFDGAEQLRQVLKTKVKKGSGAEKKRKRKVKKLVDGILDYRELARLTLGPHWKQRTDGEKKEFTELLRDLIEASYMSTISDNINFKLKLEEEEIEESGDKASVWIVASAKNSKGRIVAEDLTFHMFLRDGRWLVYDIEFGDVSIVRHYRAEFNRKIKKESYAALIAAMRKKLEEIRAGKVKIGKQPASL